MSWLLTAVGLLSQSTPEQAAPPTKRTPKRNENARRFARKPSIEKASIEEAFSNINKNRSWGDDGRGSGPGSRIENTQGAFWAILDVIDRKGITHVLDAPCGGMVWQEPMLRRLANTHPALRYFGVDVVPSVIATNKQLGLPNARFALVNLASQRLPTESFFRRTPGLLFSRDALQHNTLGDVWQILANFASTRASYCWLARTRAHGAPKHLPQTAPSTCVSRQNAARATSTSNRVHTFDIDLAKPPFSMLPVATYPEGLPDGKTLYLYPMATVRRRVEEFGVSAPEK